MRDQERCQQPEHGARGDAEQGLLGEIEHGAEKREFAVAAREREQREGQDRAHRVVEGGFAHHGLRDAVADPDLTKNRDQGRRVGRCQGGAEQAGDGERQAEHVIGRQRGDARGDQEADGRDHHDGDPDLFQYGQPQRRTAVEQDIARAEQQDGLVERGIRADVDQPERVRADRDSRQEKERDVRNPDLLRQERRQRAEGEDQPAGQQRVLGDFDRGR